MSILFFATYSAFLTGGSVIATHFSSYENIRYNESYGEPGDYVMSEPNLEAINGTSTLTIKSVKLRDDGTYRCQVAAEGPAKNSFATLDVIG